MWNNHLQAVCIFSIVFSILFIRCGQGEFLQQSRVSLVSDHLLYSHGLDVWFRGDTFGKIRLLLLLGVKGLS